MDFLGFRIDTANGTVKYIQPTQQWQFRSIHSAASMESLLTGLRSRVHLILRHTYPKEHIKHSILERFSHYESRGFKRKDLLQVTAKTLKRRRIKIEM
jgi:hypothetical protein